MKLRIARKICKAVGSGSERYHPAQLHRALQRTERTKSEKENAAFFDDVINLLTGKPSRICRHRKKDEHVTVPQQTVSAGMSPQPFQIQAVSAGICPQAFQIQAMGAAMSPRAPAKLAGFRGLAGASPHFCGHWSFVLGHSRMTNDQ